MLKPKDILALEALGLGGDGGGGGSSVTVEPLTVTANGTQTAPSGKAFNPVTTNVPNSYGASDEGKVVSNGALVAQTAHAPVTANGTIDTTLYNSVPVNVQGNPNYVETISGTVDNPFGTMTTSEIRSLIGAVIDNDASLEISFTRDGKYYSGSAVQYLNQSTGVKAEGVLFSFVWASSSAFSYAMPYFAFLNDQYRSGGQAAEGENLLVSFMSLQQWAQTASATTMTIVHHPLPDSE